MKRSWQREDAKKGGQLCTPTKMSSEMGFLSVNWATPEKRWGLRTYFFKKTTGSSRFCYFSLGNFEQNNASSLEILQNDMTLIGNETKFFVIFSLLTLKMLVISCLTPGNPTYYFFNIPGKSKSWNSPFCDLTWTDKLLIMRY